jgi:hypothetical protein
MNHKLRSVVEETLYFIEIMQHDCETRVPIRGSNPYKAHKPVKRAVRRSLIWRADVERVAWDRINETTHPIRFVVRGDPFVVFA